MREKRIFTSLILALLCLVSFAQEDFYALDSAGCAPFTTKFSLDHTTIDTNTASSVYWDFGNLQTSSKFNPDSVHYNNPGTYTVTMILNENTTSPIVKTNYIQVGRMMESDFIFDTLNSELQYVFTPNNLISDTDADYYFNWLYYDRNGSVIENVTDTFSYSTQQQTVDTFLFPDYGTYSTTLSIRDSYGCVDSTEEVIYVFQNGNTDEGFVVGNVYAPNSSNQDYFIIKASNPDVVLSFKLFSRTGVLLFSSESEIIFWDGRTNYGRELGTGVYYYVLEAIQGDDTGYYSKSGFIHLFR